MKCLSFLLLIVFVNSALAEKFKFVAIGDVPYIEPTGAQMFQKLIQQINSLKPDFVLHVGDIKGGNQNCSDDYYVNIAKLFNEFESPLLYTPGDNEWTDCHRPTAGSWNSLERLSYLRKTFFAKPESFGKSKLKLESQSQNKKFAKFVENYFVNYKMGLVASLHVVGSNNNLNKGNEEATKEYLERQLANLAWLDEVFMRAQKAKFFILFFHAETGWGKKDSKFEGYKSIHDKIVECSEKSKTPTLIIHGDDHKFKIDHPIHYVDNKTGLYGQRAQLMRLQVYGFPDVRAVEVQVDTMSEQPFSFYSHPGIPWLYKKDVLNN